MDANSTPNDLRADAVDHRHLTSLKDLSTEMQACIDACVACSQSCEQTMQKCLEMGGSHSTVTGLCADLSDGGQFYEPRFGYL
jgi:hypothetical protein